MDAASYQMLFLHLLIKLYDFILYFVNVVYHIESFVYVGPTLCPWKEPHLIMMHYFFKVLPYLIC